MRRLISALALLVAVSADALVTPKYILYVYIFTIEKGHTLQLASYRDIIVLGPYTLDDCDSQGEAHFRGFRSTVDKETMSRDMLGYQCEANAHAPSAKDE